MNIPTFKELLDQQDKPFKGLLLALDPGQTTGYAFFKGGILIKSGQLSTPNPEKATINIRHLLSVEGFTPDFLVHESYRIYAWKLAQHSNSEVVTSQIIGSIKTLCTLQHIPYGAQTAQVAKQFCTDDKLRHWDFWIVGEQHARDAIRHGVYFLLFNYKKLKEKS